MSLQNHTNSSFANFLWQKRQVSTNQDKSEFIKFGLKALAKMSFEEFEGLKQLIKILMNGGEHNERKS